MKFDFNANRQQAEKQYNLGKGEYFKVKSGDNLYGIADLFDCTAADLKRWNKIKRNYLVAGQTLVFYVPVNKKAKYQKMNGLSLKQKKVLIYGD